MMFPPFIRHLGNAGVIYDTMRCSGFIGSEVIEARLTSPIELQSIVLTKLVATYLARRLSLGDPEPVDHSKSGSGTDKKAS